MHVFCLQLLISGSLDSLDFDDLRQNTNYVGGYHSVSCFSVILILLIEHTSGKCMGVNCSLISWNITLSMNSLFECSRL